MDFLRDYPNALQRAKVFDDRVITDGSKISLDYADLLTLAVRQAFSGTELTISRNPDGSYNTSDVLLFVKGMWSQRLFDRRPDHSFLLVSQRYQVVVYVWNRLYPGNQLTSILVCQYRGCYIPFMASVPLRKPSTWKSSTTPSAGVPSDRPVS